MVSFIVLFSLLIAGQVTATGVAPSIASATVEAVNPDANQGEANDLFDAYFDQFYGGRYADALATAGKIEVDEDNAQGRALIKAMRAAALVGLKRDKEAVKLFAEADASAPSIVLISTLQFESGLYADNSEVAAAALDRMISRTPDEVRKLSMDSVTYFLRNEPKGQDKRNQDRRVALAELGYGGATGDYFTADAVEILMKGGEKARAEELIAYIDDPATLEDFLIQRRYSALWPKLEEIVGANLGKARESSVQAARREYEENRDSNEKQQFFIGALRNAGQLDAAIAFRSNLPTTPAALASIDSDIGWMFNEVALALHEAGRKDEADQLYALLNEAKIDDGGWRVSMIINRLELLVSDGRFDQAMPLLKATETSAAENGNSYSRQLVRRLKYCTLSGLGRKDEAAALLPELLKYAADAPGPTVDALLCAGQVDEAEKLALASLKDEKFEYKFVRSLQRVRLTSDDPSVWDEAWQDLRQRPAISKEFDRLGRDMPEQFLPPARQPIEASSGEGRTARQ